MTSMKTTN